MELHTIYTINGSKIPFQNQKIQPKATSQCHHKDETYLPSIEDQNFTRKLIP